MSFGDRLRAWFKGETKRAAPSPSTDRSSRSSTRDLAEFVASRSGVEAFVEPRTALYSTTLLLVADDGEYLRRPVNDPGQAASFCDKHEIPLYDARKVGYPRRMHDFEAGTPQRGISLEELPPWPGGETPDDPEPGGPVAEDPTPDDGPDGGPPGRDPHDPGDGPRAD